MLIALLVVVVFLLSIYTNNFYIQIIMMNHE